MSFFKKVNPKRSLYLQLIGFQSNTYLDIVGSLIDLPIFKLPDIQFSENSITNLEVANNLRLGNRLERFFSYIIQESGTYEILFENLQINDNKITIGELDFILFNKKTKQVIHVELAGKLYLYDPNIQDELARWIGPNRKDSLLQKTKRLKEKQFPLLFNKVTATYFNDNLDVNEIEQQVCFKARLFLPYSINNQIPDYISIDNIKGYYLRFNEFTSYDEKPFKYYIPDKQDWIVDPKNGEIWMSFTEILPKVKESLLHERSPLLWVKKDENTYQTIFVVWW